MDRETLDVVQSLAQLIGSTTDAGTASPTNQFHRDPSTPPTPDSQTMAPRSSKRTLRDRQQSTHQNDGEASPSATSASVVAASSAEAGAEIVLQSHIWRRTAEEDRRARQKAEDDSSFLRHKLKEMERKFADASQSAEAAERRAVALERAVQAKESAAALHAQTATQLRDQLQQQQKERSAAKPPTAATMVMMPNTAVGAGADPIITSPMMGRQTTEPAALLLGPLAVSATSADFANNANNNNSSGNYPRSDTASSTRSTKAFLQHQFNETLTAKTRNIRLKKRCETVRRFALATAEAHERELMASEDTFAQMSMRNARHIDDVSAFPAPSAAVLGRSGSGSGSNSGGSQQLRRSHSSSSLVSFESLKRHSRAAASDFGETLDIHRRTPQDEYLEARIKASAFCEPLTALRGDMLALCQDWKQASDASLTAFQYLFAEAEKPRGQSVLANPRDDLARQLKAAAAKTKAMLLELLRRASDGVKAVVGMERAVKSKWQREGVKQCDFSAQHDSEPPEDPRLAPLRERVQFLEGRLEKARDDHEANRRALDLAKEKAEVNMLLLQQKATGLHEAVFGAVHAVYKHRFHWDARCPSNSFPAAAAAAAQQLPRQRLLEVQYNSRLGEAFDADVAMLRRFAAYFVSDDLFGSDLLTTLSNHNVNRDAAATTPGKGLSAAGGSNVNAKDASPQPAVAFGRRVSVAGPKQNDQQQPTKQDSLFEKRRSAATDPQQQAASAAAGKLQKAVRQLMASETKQKEEEEKAAAAAAAQKVTDDANAIDKDVERPPHSNDSEQRKRTLAERRRVQFGEGFQAFATVTSPTDRNSANSPTKANAMNDDSDVTVNKISNKSASAASSRASSRNEEGDDRASSDDASQQHQPITPPTPPTTLQGRRPSIGTNNNNGSGSNERGGDNNNSVAPAALRRQPNSTANVAANSGGGSGLPASSKRMEEWHKKQAQLWESRRNSLAIHTSFDLAVKLDPSPTEVPLSQQIQNVQQQRTGSVTGHRRPSIIGRHHPTASTVSHNGSHSHSAAAGQQQVATAPEDLLPSLAPVGANSLGHSGRRR